MDQLFEARTKSTERTYIETIYRNFFKFHTWNQLKLKWAYAFLVALGAIIYIVCAIVLVMGSTDYLTIGCAIFLATFLIIYPWFAHMLPYRMWKSSYKSWGLTNIFSFYSDYLEVSNQQQKSKIYYHQFFRIYETTDYFYLYLNKMSALIIAKESITLGSPEELRAFLQQKLGAEYKIVK